MREFLTVEENLRCAMRFFGEATGKGEVRTLDRTVAMYSGLEYGVFNISLLTRSAIAGDGGLDAALTETAQYFKEHTQRWSFWLCEDLAGCRDATQIPADLLKLWAAANLVSAWHDRGETAASATRVAAD